MIVLSDKRREAVRDVAVGAVIGVVAGGAAVAVGELVAVVTGENSAPAVAVGGWAIDHAPTSVKEFAIRNFGTHDKTALLGGVYLALLLIAMGTGILARRHLTSADAVMAVFGIVGALAAVTRPAAGVSALFPSLLGALAGVLALTKLTQLWLTDVWSGAASSETDAGLVPPEDPDRDADAHEGADPEGRRRFLLALSGTAAGAALVGLGGKWLISQRGGNVSAARAAVRIPTPAVRLAPLPASVHPNVPGLGPFLTPNADFYRVDTALVLPEVDPSSWTLRIHGMVDRPVEITYADLLKLELEEHDLTLTCVSNPVGGSYCGNARWIGTPLAPLLRQAGVRQGADQILSTSTDGMTIGTPTAAVLDGRAAMLAVAMNGEVLPIEHGFPCRMLVPGLYGYVSATKWVTDLQLTTFASTSAYWVTGGWSQQAPVKTASRIDVPGDGANVSAGTVTVAGTAWATHRGVDAVEVSVDDGPWTEATLAAADTVDTWRQWSYQWAAPRGSHTLRVRATDGTGTVQTAVVQGVVPNGASGYHTIGVTVA